MRAIKLQIQRKTRVPTKHQIVHQERSDWKTFGYVEYADSVRLFRLINENAVMESDAQFAKWLYDKFGKGIYKVIYWKKGMKGFRNFILVRCNDNGTYVRLKKTRTPEEIDKMRAHRNYEDLKKKHAVAIGETKADLEVDLKQEEEIMKAYGDDSKTPKRGPSPYLKSKQPVYSLHEYENWERVEEEETSKEQSFW